MANTLINTKVMGEVLGAELPAKLKFKPFREKNRAPKTRFFVLEAR